MEALHNVVKAGKARYIGASNMAAWQFARALYVADKHGWTRFATMQDQLNLLYREEEREMLPLCRAEGIGFIPWSPLARGRLTRNWDETTERQENDEFGKMLFAKSLEPDRLVIDRVAAVAKARGVSRAQVALAWVLQKQEVTAPIIGASRLQHFDDVIASLSLKLTPEEIATLEEHIRPDRSGGERASDAGPDLQLCAQLGGLGSCHGHADGLAAEGDGRVGAQAAGLKRSVGSRPPSWPPRLSACSQP
jgi:aryl-alcohol dehydrogenase-like predicted oxidoreductase